MTAAVPESERCASALNVDPLHVTLMVTPSIRIEGDQSDEAASATEASKFGFIGEVVTNWGTEYENWIPMASDSSVGLTARPMGTGTVVSSPHRHQGANQNQFSPLSSMGREKGFCFGERDNPTKVSGEKGEKWSNPHVELVSSSYLDGKELLQDGSEHFLLQWKHSEANPSGFSHGEEESGLLECSPLSKWDPNEQKELEVIQAGS